jgi:MFS family permease
LLPISEHTDGGFLAVDNGWATDVDSAGYVAGWLATFTLIARIPTSTFWGLAADRWGSKLCLQLSLLAIATGCLLFGLSSALWAAVASRALFLGALNGWPTLTGLCAAEVGGEARQAAALSQIIAAGGICGLIGPAVGGWTYASVPALPRALPPNIMAAALALGAAALVQVWYKPGTPDKPDKPGSENEGGDDAPAHDVSTWRALCTRPLPLVLGYRSAMGLYLYLLWDVFPLHAAGHHIGHPWHRPIRLGRLSSSLSCLRLALSGPRQARLGPPPSAAAAISCPLAGTALRRPQSVGSRSTTRPSAHS